MHTYYDIHMHVRINVHAHCTYYIHTHTCTCIWIYVYIYKYAQTCTYTVTNTYTHTYKYTNAYTPSARSLTTRLWYHAVYAFSSGMWGLGIASTPNALHKYCIKILEPYDKAFVSCGLCGSRAFSQ